MTANTSWNYTLPQTKLHFYQYSWVYSFSLFDLQATKTNKHCVANCSIQ